MSRLEPRRARRVARTSYLLVVAILFTSACTSGDADDRHPPDARALSAAVAEYEDVVPDVDQLRAIVAAVDDRIVFEKYYGTDAETYWDVQSVTKSVLSALVGIAVDDGLLGLDGTLDELLPRYADVMSPDVAATTLRQLLTMTAGFPSGTQAAAPGFTGSRDWVRHILTHPVARPGERFVYSNGSAHVVAAVLQQATGMSLLEYARARLLGPLGIDTTPALHARADQERQAAQLTAYQDAGFAWPRDPQGVETGWWGLKLRPEDMIKLGELYLAGGRWHGRQVVPRDWVEASTTRQVATAGPVKLGDGYGYFWWTGTADHDDAYRALGYGGQLIEVVPDRDLVVVTTTELRLDDPTSHGVNLDALTTMIDDAVVSAFPSR